MEAGLLLTRSIDIDLGPRVASSGQPQETLSPLTRPERLTLKPGDGGSGGSGQDTPSHYPRGILTPERRRAMRRHGGESLKAVSFNPRTECLLLEEV